MIPILSGNVASALPTGYTVDNSCRFNDGDSPKLNINFGSDGTLNKWTFSMWFKRSTLGTAQRLFCCLDTGMDDYIKFGTDDQIEWGFDHEDSNRGILKTNRKFRDVSAWYHLVCRLDTTDSTAGDRMRMYINGTEETSFATDTNPPQNETGDIGRDNNHYIGTSGSSQYFDGYIAEVCMINNQSLAPTSFGEFDSDSPTIWKPIDVSGLTFGDNGFYFPFSDSADLGADSSGNSNDFTSTNLAATDQATDTPTNNFATLNPIAFENAGGTGRMSEGNLRLDGDSSTAHNLSVGTIAVNKGKWWFEAEIDAYGGSNPSIGIASYDINLSLGNYVGGLTGTIGYTGNGNINENGSNLETGLNSYTSGDIINIGLDLDNNKIYAYKNGSLENTGGTTITNRLYTFAVSQYSNTGHWLCNFGASTPYTISSGNADDNGYGNFEYDVPSGYYALCTKNLAEFGG